MRPIRIFAKNMGDPYYEPTIVVHDDVILTAFRTILSTWLYNYYYYFTVTSTEGLT